MCTIEASGARASHLLYTLLIVLTTFTTAERKRLGVEQEGKMISNHEARSQEAMAGQMLRGRYELQSLIETRGYMRSGPPQESFPYISERRGEFGSAEEGISWLMSSGPDHLGTGSFGDVWRAWDYSRNEEVAVKIFYSEDQFKRKRYLTWPSASPDEKDLLAQSIDECNLIKDMLDNARLDPIGASRLCKCHRQHISDVRDPPVDEVVFIVQEMCGQNLNKGFIVPTRQSGRLDTRTARRLTFELLEGINFLQRFTPAVIHHDLKPDNVNIKNGHIKIIDFGLATKAVEKNMRAKFGGTEAYMPPESTNRIAAFLMPAYSYDVYAVGLMHMQLLCPWVQPEDWWPVRPLTQSKVQSILNRYCSGGISGNDVELITRLTDQVATRRLGPLDVLEGAVDEARPQEPQTLTFQVGDWIEYNSASLGERVPGVIAKVNANSYDIEYPNGEPMKTSADPVRVTPPLLSLKVGDAVEYRDVRYARLILAVIAKIDTRAQTYDIVKPDGTPLARGVDTTRVRNQQVKVSDVPIAKRATRPLRHDGNPLYAENIITPVVQTDSSDTGKYVQITSPGFKYTDTETLATSYVTCLYPAQCRSFQKVELDCGGQRSNHPLSIVHDSMAQVELAFGKDDPRNGQRCVIWAVATILLDGQTKQARSYETIFYPPRAFSSPGGGGAELGWRAPARVQAHGNAGLEIAPIQGRSPNGMRQGIEIARGHGRSRMGAAAASHGLPRTSFGVGEEVLFLHNRLGWVSGRVAERNLDGTYTIVNSLNQVHGHYKANE